MVQYSAEDCCHVFMISILSSNMCQDYWPQDDPNHWLYYEDSQASQLHRAVVELFVFSTSITHWMTSDVGCSAQLTVERWQSIREAGEARWKVSLANHSLHVCGHKPKTFLRRSQNRYSSQADRRFKRKTEGSSNDEATPLWSFSYPLKFFQTLNSDCQLFLNILP